MAGSGTLTLKKGLKTGLTAGDNDFYAYTEAMAGNGAPTFAAPAGAVYVKADATVGTTWLYRRHATSSTTWLPNSDD